MMTSAPSTPLVVAGLGNLLMGDDGIGVHLVQELERAPLPDATLLDVGTAILHALPLVEQAQHLVLLDAMDGEQPPGTIYLRQVSAGPQVERPLSVHALDLLSTLRLMSGSQALPRTLVIGIQPASIECRLGLSAELQALLPTLAEQVRYLAQAWRLGLGVDDLQPSRDDDSQDRFQDTEPLNAPVHA